jgi:hypothetical protein
MKELLLLGLMMGMDSELELLDVIVRFEGIGARGAISAKISSSSAASAAEIIESTLCSCETWTIGIAAGVAIAVGTSFGIDGNEDFDFGFILINSSSSSESNDPASAIDTLGEPSAGALTSCHCVPSSSMGPLLSILSA